MKKITFILTTFLSLTFLVFSACQSVQTIPNDMSAAKLLQAGQDCVSLSQYKNAEAYFTATIQRYGTDNAIYVEARYELGNVYLKEKKYAKAEVVFKEIIEMYEDAEFGALPAAFQKLAEIGLNKIP